MCRQLGNACWRWVRRRENATWLGVCYWAVLLGMFCWAADQPSGPLGDVIARFLSAGLAHWFGLAHPELSRWLVETSANSVARAVLRLTRFLGSL